MKGSSCTIPGKRSACLENHASQNHRGDCQLGSSHHAWSMDSLRQEQHVYSFASSIYKTLLRSGSLFVSLLTERWVLYWCVGAINIQPLTRLKIFTVTIHLWACLAPLSQHGL